MVAQWMPAITVNSFALLILGVLLFDTIRKTNRFILADQRLFNWMIITNIAMLVLDGGTWLVDGRMFPGARTWNLFFTVGYYLLNPVMSLLYICFCDIKMGLSKTKRDELLLLYLLPVALNLIATLLSIEGSYLFHIDENNVYQRGSLLSLSFVFSTLLMVLAFVKVFAYSIRRGRQRGLARTPSHRRHTRPLMFFAIPPILGVVVQIWYHQVTVIWLATVISLLIMFINIQNAEIATDTLTGLFNRRHTDYYLQNLFQLGHKQKPFRLLLMDLNNFKQINDRFGHNAGDNALKLMGAALQSVCGKSAFYSRYGGDEFVIITRQSYPECLALIERINQHLSRICLYFALPYSLSISAGIAEWSPDITSPDALFAQADSRLYQQKSRLGRRATD